MGPLASGACYDIVYGCESDYDKHKIWEHPVLNLSTRSFKVLNYYLGNFLVPRRTVQGVRNYNFCVCFDKICVRCCKMYVACSKIIS